MYVHFSTRNKNIPERSSSISSVVAGQRRVDAVVENTALDEYQGGRRSINGDSLNDTHALTCVFPRRSSSSHLLLRSWPVNKNMYIASEKAMCTTKSTDTSIRACGDERDGWDRPTPPPTAGGGQPTVPRRQPACRDKRQPRTPTCPMTKAVCCEDTQQSASQRQHMLAHLSVTHARMHFTKTPKSTRMHISQ